MGGNETKEYTGSVYIGVVGSELENGVCRDSIQNVRVRTGDSTINFVRATKGYEARQEHFERWKKTHHPFMLLLDADQVVPPDTLERLRSHKLPYVSGYYMRRRYNPIAPVWFKLPPKHTWPLEPYLDDPERGRLHDLGGSGWGCLLIHRDVVDAVDPILKGENYVIEDDLDLWPYDLDRIMWALNGLTELVEEKPPARMLRSSLEKYHEALREEIRPLRGEKSTVVGSDLRFPFYAREAGFVLKGDPDCRIGHMLNYPLDPDDFSGMPDSKLENLRKDTKNRVIDGRRKLQRHVNNLGQEQ